MLRIGQKDTVAYRELVGKHLSKGVRVAQRMLGNRSRQDAEDIMQEVCLKIWNEAPRWKPTAKFSTWLYRVLLNACIDHTRKVIPLTGMDMEAIIDHTPTHDERLMKENRSLQVEVALQKLPERQRAAVVLSYYEGVSNQEAADALGVALGAFQQLLFRAKHNLKEELQEYLREYKHG